MHQFNIYSVLVAFFLIFVYYYLPSRRGRMVVQIVSAVFQIYFLLLFGRILGSWIPELQETRFMHFIAFYTDPYLNLFRKIIPPLGMIDISPIFAFLALELLKSLILGWLR